MTHHIVMYGKGGAGKSSLTSNISASLVEAGFSVMQVGCDPKGDSCSLLNNGVSLPTVFDRLREKADLSVDSIAHTCYKGITCVELGDSIDSNCCASSEFSLAFKQLNRIRLFESIVTDYVLYDMSGDSFCAGFHAPLQQPGVCRVFVATTADYMSLHAANSIFRMLERYGESHVPVPFGGLIPNAIASSFEESFIRDFADHTHTRTLGRVPRSLMVRQCELYGKTVIESSPLSNQSYYYRRLANQIVDVSQSETKSPPRPLSPEQLRMWAREWGDRIYALENGLVTDGAAI